MSLKEKNLQVKTTFFYAKTKLRISQVGVDIWIYRFKTQGVYYFNSAM